MRWENLTAAAFPRAVAESSGVLIVPIGVIEPHASHLPLGQDTLEAHHTACRAAEREPAVVFPAYAFGINHESAHLPGSVVIRRETVMTLLAEVCSEAARHGLTKILLLSGHGGNRYFLPLFVQTVTQEKCAYVPYFMYAGPRTAKVAAEVLDGDEHGHACESETSVALHIHPELVDTERIPARPFTSLRRNAELKAAGVYGALDWYEMYPAMYVGDARPATAEKGKALSDAHIEDVVDALRAIKADSTTPELLSEYHAHIASPRPASEW